jgi:lipoyl(octanoyl) transferase
MTALRDISLPPDPGGDLGERTLVRAREIDTARPLLLGDGGILAVEWLGRVPYRPTWERQNELADQRRRRKIGDRVLLLEHEPVYTIGRGGDEANLLANPERMDALGAELVRIDRGGDITFHGPGQLVAYPIVELADPLDLRRYVRALESAVISTAFRFGVQAERVDGLPGVWVDGTHKLAAVGVRVRRGVTTHGLALNVSTDLAWFDEMVPCGIPGCQVTSLQRETGHSLLLTDVADILAADLARAFGLKLADSASPTAAS